MTIQLTVSSACPHVYLPEGAPGGPWIAFVLPKTAVLPSQSYMISDWIWPNDGQTILGYWVFAPTPPTDLAAFARSLWVSAAGRALTCASIPVWYTDAALAALESPAFMATDLGSNGLESIGNTNFGFGRTFDFHIPPNSVIRYASDSDTLTVTAKGTFTLSINGRGISSGLDTSLDIAMAGTAAGVLTLGAQLSFDPSPDSSNLGIHYRYRMEQGGVAGLDFPLFGRGTLENRTYAVALDPASPFDPTRSRFAFGTATGALGSGYTSPTGRTVQLAPQPGAALVFRSLYGSDGGSCLEPDGTFVATLCGASEDAVVGLLCGSSGTESLEGPAGSTLTFGAGAAYCPFDPTAAQRSSVAVPLEDQDGEAVTAWVSVSAVGAATAAYVTQPAQSALFAADAAQPAYLYSAVARPLLSGAGLPALPMAPYGCFDELESVAADAYRALETKALASARTRLTAVSAKSTVKPRAVAEEQTCVTNAGLVVTESGAASTSLCLARTVDSGGTGHVWSVDDLSPALQTALASSQCFVVASRTADSDAAVLFTLAGEVAFFDWTFTPAVSAAQLFILKFATPDIRTLAGTLAAWTDAPTFNTDPQAVQTSLLSFIESVSAAVDAGDTLYATLWSALTDPGWNGAMVLAPPATTLPATVSGMLAGENGTLSAWALAVQINDLGAAEDGSTIITGSAPFAVVDESGGGTASPAGGGAYGYALDRLRAGFDNGTMTSFTATGRLEINRLFGVPAALQDDDGDAPSNIIPLSGSYQQPTTAGAVGYYKFTSGETATFRMSYEYDDSQAPAQILRTVVVAAVQFAPIGDDASCFSLSGTLVFNGPAAAADEERLDLGIPPTVDLFDFDGLAYAGLGIVMSGSGADVTYAFDVSHATFPAPRDDLRPGLASDLPLTAKAMLPAGSISDLGAIPLDVPTGWTIPSDAFDFAIALSLTLGTPGLQASQTGSLTGTLYLGWTADGNYSLGLLIDGIGQGRTVTLQGAAKLTIGGVSVGSAIAQGGVTRTVLLLQRCSLRFMGGSAPGGAQPFTLSLFGVPATAPGTLATKLLWYGSAYTTSMDRSTGVAGK